MATRKQVRRTPGRPAGGSEAIVKKVLSETLHQIGQRGIAALSVEDIAQAAGVNKTTVYRRWPTKADLVLAALQAAKESEPPFEASGDLREDLVRVMQAKATSMCSPRGRKLAVALAALDDPAAGRIAESMRERRCRIPILLMKEAQDRGELARDADPEMLSEILLALVVQRVLLSQTIDRVFMVRAVDHVLGPRTMLRGASSARRSPASKKQL